MTYYNPQEIEKEVQAFWKREGVPEKITSLDPKRKKFFLLDGPPYINYEAHVGNAMTTVFKDIWGKFKYMQGFGVWFQPVFDCSGLPIEHAVEKKLGIQSKRDIEKMGVKKFIAECRSHAEQNLVVWMDLYKSMGAWKGWLDPALTYKNYYLESGWWALKKMFERGLLVEGNKAGFWCTHCETVLAGYETTDSYKQVTDPSIYIKFPVRGEPQTFLLVWTTTPWTLPGNVAIAVHPQEMYVRATVDGEQLILAEKRLQVLKDIGKKVTVVKKFKGKELEGMKYSAVVDTPDQRRMDKEFHSVILSIKLLKKRAGAKVGGEDVFEDFVTMETGTGLVHTSPGQGDTKIGEHYKLAALSPTNDQGCFTEEAGKYKGLYVKKADPIIIEDLQKAGLLLHAGTVSHSYPLCWRCKTPLIYRMSKQWFLSLDTIRDRMIKDNKQVNWLPAFGRDRFHEVLSTAPDWAVTRQRYWGIPLPIWECGSCESKKVIGSAQELKKHALEKLPENVDLHKDVVDEIHLRCHCGGSMMRVPDIMDVWIDSGIAPWASLGYPFRNKALFEKLWPVDLIDESLDMTRGWFYALMVCGHATFGETPFKTVCMNGWVLDGKGEKMSKSLGNVITAKEGVKQLGTDLMRLYYCVDSAPWDTKKFSIQRAKDLGKVLNVLWNAHLFVQTYGSDVKKPAKLALTDKWIVSRLHTTTKTVTEAMDSFAFHTASRALVDFILNDYSRWYVKLVRDRVSPFSQTKDKQAAQWTLRFVLEEVIKLLAPFSPVITEKIHLTLTGKSVHLQPLPQTGKRQPELEEGMETVKQLVEAMHALRQEKNVKLRWPIDKVFLHTKEDLSRFHSTIQRMGNVKEVVVVGKVTGKAKEFPGGSLALGSVVKDDALVRELIRKVQDLRKKNGLDVAQTIQLTLATDDKTEQLLKGREKDIVSGTGSSSVTFGKGGRGSLEFERKKIDIGF